jgi:MFS family permease
MASRRNRAWKMAALGSLAQNCALGLTFGSFGALMPGLEVKFGASRGVVATALGMFVLSMSLLSVPVGARLSRWSLRTTMIGGALVCSLGFALMTFAQNITQVILLYTVVVGLGVCLLGVLPASTLVSRWFDKDRGKALGLINMPILLLMTPPLTALVLTEYGINTVFASLSALFLLCAAMLIMVQDAPEPSGIAKDGGGPPPAAPTLMTTPAVLSSRAFWCLSLGVGIIAGGGTLLTAHIVPLAVGRGFALEPASLLLSAYAAAGLIGALLFGWLSDRFGARNTLVINAVGQIVLWGALMMIGVYGMMMTIAALIGLFTTSILAVHSAAINEIFGRENFSAVLGMSYLPKLVFISGSAPLAGFLFDYAGDYQIALLVQIVGFAAALLGFLFLPAQSVAMSRLAARPVTAGTGGAA